MEKYDELVNNSKKYIERKLNLITIMSNLTAYLFEKIDNINWLGFYIYDGSDLYLGPFQGKPAVTSIKISKGVCGICAMKRETVIVNNVHDFKDHIACDPLSLSEISIPIIAHNHNLFGVLDIDSPIKNRFDEDIKKALEIIVDLFIDIL